jgi:hypothetical protein
MESIAFRCEYWFISNQSIATNFEQDEAALVFIIVVTVHDQYFACQLSTTL